MMKLRGRSQKITILSTVLFAGTALLLAACSPQASGASANGGGSGAGSGQQGPGSGNRASGMITSVASNQVVIQTRAASENVGLSSSTTISQIVPGTVTDITTGSCVVARLASGASATDAAPLVSAVSVSPQINGACPVARGGRPNAGGVMPGGASTAGPGAAGGFSRPVSGVVTSASATTLAVTVTDSSGATSAAMLTLDASTTVNVTAQATASALVSGQCLTATGATDSSGFTATAVTISTPSASGCAP